MAGHQQKAVHDFIVKFVMPLRKEMKDTSFITVQSVMTD